NTGRGIHDLGGYIGEVSLPLSHGRDLGVLSLRRASDARPLVRAEIEQLVFDDGPADARAKLVALQRIVSGGKEVPRVQVPIAKEFKHVPVDFIRSGFGYD